MTTCVGIEIDGMTDQPRGRRIYFDSNAFIYAIESADDVATVLHSLFGALRKQGKAAFTSEFTLAGILPKATAAQRRSYFTLIMHSGPFALVPVTRDLLTETEGDSTFRWSAHFTTKK